MINHSIPIFLVLLWFISNVAALEVKPITTLSITNDLKIITSPFVASSSTIISRKDGAFIFQTQANYGSVAVVVITNGNSIIKPSMVITNYNQTNILQSFVENGELKLIQQEKRFTIITKTRPDLILKTISEKCYFDFIDIRTNINIQEFKISSTSKLLITNFETRYRTSIFSKIYLNGKQSEHMALRNWDNYTVSEEKYNYQSENYIDVDNKNVIMAKQDGDLISFYRLSDPDLLSSPNRITLGSSQNGSITATVNNPEQAILNIQSSTNLIDWNTFKTIQNEPSLEIVVPANKPKEFIRAVE